MTINEMFDITLSYINYFYELLYSFPLLSILQNNVAIISITCYLLWYIKAYLSRTELVCHKGSFMRHIVEKFPSFHSGYRPTIWCFPAKLNTIVFTIMQSPVKHNYNREILKTLDGGQIAIDWVNETCSKPLTLLVLTGLTGCSYDNYVTHYVDKAVKLGARAVVMNYRGIQVDLITPKSYCATDFEDLHCVVEHIRKKYPNEKLFAIGTSLGGIILGGYLAKRYDDCFISNAMIVSAPFNTFVSCEELEKSHNLFFNRILTKNLLNYFEKYKHLFKHDKKYDFHAISRCNSLRDLDHHFVSKQFGYKSYEDYYKEACLDTKIQDIKVPTLFLNAADDMFSPFRAFPIEKFSVNPNVALIITQYGGHISFAEGLFPKGCNYTCRLLNDFLMSSLTESYN